MGSDMVKRPNKRNEASKKSVFNPAFTCFSFVLFLVAQLPITIGVMDLISGGSSNGIWGTTFDYLYVSLLVACAVCLISIAVLCLYLFQARVTDEVNSTAYCCLHCNSMEEKLKNEHELKR